MNVKLLKKIKREILKEPLRFNMDFWIGTNDRTAPCHTTACIAGWATILDIKRVQPKKSWAEIGTIVEENLTDQDRFCEDGAAKLGLSPYQTQVLFYERNWPKQFQDNFGGRETKRAKRLRRAKLAAARIDHFIQTEGRE
jgi:hypothetical protein